MSPRNCPTLPPPTTHTPASPGRSPGINTRPVISGVSSRPCPRPRASPHTQGPPSPPLPPALHSPGRGKKGPKHPHHTPPPQGLRTLNTSYRFTTPSLARPSGAPRRTPGCSPTPTKPESTTEARTTSRHLPSATSSQTIDPPTPTLRSPLALARAARLKTKSANSLHPNKLRVQLPLRLKRGRPPSQVPNDAFLPLASPRDTPTIAATFPNIAARVLRESNCLLLISFSATVNPGGAISLTVTDKATLLPGTPRTSPPSPRP